MDEAIRFDFSHDVSHDGCLSLRPFGDDDELFHISEWHFAVGLQRVNVPIVAFFVLRHLLELVLKRIVFEVTGNQPWGHDVLDLLRKLPVDDPLRSSETEPESSIRALVKMVDALDRRGDAARYAFTKSGDPSFADDALRPARGTR